MHSIPLLWFSQIQLQFTFWQSLVSVEGDLASEKIFNVSTYIILGLVCQLACSFVQRGLCLFPAD